MNTIFSYMYADASNYKVFKDVVIKGELRISDVEQYLYEGEFFIPSEVGLSDLQPTPFTVEDHVWHTIRDLSTTDANPNCDVESAQLKERFAAVSRDKWNLAEVFRRKGLL
jgi:hypothetical protein